MPSPDDLRLIDRLHGGFPLSERPFADVAAELGLSEETVIDRLRRLLAHGELTRFGPLFQIERAGGRFVLAAMAVPEERFEAVAAQLGAMREIAHNYRRESARPDAPGATPLNMWFVIAVESANEVDAVVERIEAMTGLAVYAFPKEREFFVELRLPLLPGDHHAAR
ncbi:AsnC family transcriptional regulator [Tibeticola sp.]|jgi:DNA-binding Lrp family transcriptional regulator|uniref:Lrp/AsnC family transcriptional regulator n=1 Tax=Tibeticola sp. TaxID=2005368 RepID=UPI002589CC07|nr:AsnC family transcriptional regulator [Tibeticola sp.]MCI4439787.1 AsnC family transcriptional regulator [Tibeticola sp.]